MRSFVLAALAAAFVLCVCGCPQTAPPKVATQDTLMEKYKESGEHKVTILYFKNSRCPIDTERVLEGVQNLSEGSVLLKVVDGDVDREGKNAYGIKTYPTVLFFDADGKLKDSHGPGLDMDKAKEMVKKYGATIKALGGEEEEEAPPKAPETPEKSGEGEGGG